MCSGEQGALGKERLVMNSVFVFTYDGLQSLYVDVMELDTSSNEEEEGLKCASRTMLPLTSFEEDKWKGCGVSENEYENRPPK